MKKIITFIGVVLAVATITVACLMLLQRNPWMHLDGNEDVSEVDDNIPATESSDDAPSSFEPIDFQPIVDAWVNSTTGNRSILLYDLDREELIGSYNPDEIYNTASLYKLFVVYEGYRRVQSGVWDENAYVGATGRTTLDCLDLAIRESYSPCAETLWSMIGHETLDQIIRDDFGITNSNISLLTSNARDILRMMQIFYKHEEILSENLVSRMKDSFLNQPATTYNWRQGLPSGFSVANVYDKVGWDYNPSGGYWNIYHDAAIVEYPEENRHFVVVVMTNRVPFQKIRDFGAALEADYIRQTAS